MSTFIVACIVVLSAVFYGAGFYAAAQVWGFITVCELTLAFVVIAVLLMLLLIKEQRVPVRGVE